MRQFVILNGLKKKALQNTVHFATKEVFRGWILLAILGLLFFVTDYWFFKRIINYIVTLPLNLEDIMIPQFLMVICLTFFSMLVFSNIIASISNFYLSSDIDLLISSPLGIKEIYASRFLQTCLNSSLIFFIFGIPIFISLGNSYSAGAIYYFGMVANFVPFIVIPAGIGITFTVLLMRYFPAKKTHQFLTVTGLLFMGGLVMFFRFLQPEKFLGEQIPEHLMQQYVENLKIPSYWFLPSTWTARGMEAGVRGENLEMAWWTAVSWVFAIAITWLNISIISRTYYKGWAISHAGRGAENSKPKKNIFPFLETLLSFLPSQLRAILLKDLRVFFRDPAQWSQIFMLLALVIIYIFNIRSLPMDTIFIKNLISFLNIGLSGVVIAAVGVRFVFTTTSVEGAAFWLLKSGPVDFKQYLWGKFFFYLIPLLFLSETLIVVSNTFLDVDNYLMMYSVIGIFLITIGLTGLGVGLGAIYPVFKYENIAELATSTGAIYYMLISLAYIGAVVMLGARPIWVHFSLKFLAKGVGGAEIYLFYSIAVALTIAVTWIPIHLGIKSLAKS